MKYKVGDILASDVTGHDSEVVEVKDGLYIFKSNGHYQMKHSQTLIDSREDIHITSSLLSRNLESL